MIRRHAHVLGAIAALVALTALVGSATAGRSASGSSSFEGSQKLRKALEVDGIIDAARSSSRRSPTPTAATAPPASAGTTHRSTTSPTSSSKAGWKVEPAGVRLRRLLPGRRLGVRADGTGPARPTSRTRTTRRWSSRAAATSPRSWSAIDLDAAARRGAEHVEPGCEPEDFTGTGVSGKIALMQRGTCDFRVKVDNAASGRRRRRGDLQRGPAGPHGRHLRHPGRPERRDPRRRHELRAPARISRTGSPTAPPGPPSTSRRSPTPRSARPRT